MDRYSSKPFAQYSLMTRICVVWGIVVVGNFGLSAGTSDTVTLHQLGHALRADRERIFLIEDVPHMYSRQRDDQVREGYVNDKRTSVVYSLNGEKSVTGLVDAFTRSGSAITISDSRTSGTAYVNRALANDPGWMLNRHIELPDTDTTVELGWKILRDQVGMSHNCNLNEEGVSKNLIVWKHGRVPKPATARDLLFLLLRHYKPYNVYNINTIEGFGSEEEFFEGLNREAPLSWAPCALVRSK